MTCILYKLKNIYLKKIIIHLFVLLRIPAFWLFWTVLTWIILVPSCRPATGYWTISWRLKKNEQTSQSSQRWSLCKDEDLNTGNFEWKKSNICRWIRFYKLMIFNKVQKQWSGRKLRLTNMTLKRMRTRGNWVSEVFLLVFKGLISSIPEKI